MKGPPLARGLSRQALCIGPGRTHSRIPSLTSPSLPLVLRAPIFLGALDIGEAVAPRPISRDSFAHRGLSTRTSAGRRLLEVPQMTSAQRLTPGDRQLKYL